MKKILSIIAICIIGVLAFTGCTKEENIEGSLPEIMDKLYEGIKDEEKPMMLSNIEIDDESFEYYDSTLKKKILWNGAAWVNIDGTELS